ncbi:MAG: hypothetical protein HKN20_08815 [Gemmatimonadetes bacterium]|nr:hypothetical protein [Gemmatimonadota bacterium]
MKRAFLTTLLILTAGCLHSARADTLMVTVQSFNFAPNALTIQLGDTVHWKYVNGSHTVTSGTGPGDPNVGALFNSPISAGAQNFFYTFADTAGVYNYHCTPHSFLGMTGSVTVEEPITVGIPAYDPDQSWSDLKQLFR